MSAAPGPPDARRAKCSSRAAPRRRLRAAVTTATACGLVGAGLAGCPSSSPALPYTPYTGINISSGTLLQGVGCGTACSQVYKYVVVVGDPSDAAAPSLSPLPDGAPGAYASLSSCNTDTVFASLASGLDGGTTLEAWIYAYNQADFLAAQSAVPTFASCGEATCPLTLADVQAIVNTASTYTTTCKATPESGDNVLASCLPLVPSPTTGADGAVSAGGPECASAQAHPGDAGADAGTGAGDAGADAGTGAGDAGIDAGDAGMGAGDAGMGAGDAGADAGGDDAALDD